MCCHLQNHVLPSLTPSFTKPEHVKVVTSGLSEKPAWHLRLGKYSKKNYISVT